MFTELNETMIKEVKQGLPHKIYNKNRDSNYLKKQMEIMKLQSTVIRTFTGGAQY